MSEAERVALGDTIAGTNQYKVLAAVMQNFEHATDATTTALNSSGSAIKENAAYMESLEAKTTALKATFQDLANNVIDDELVGAVLDLTNGALSMLNNELGATVIQVGLVSGTMFGALTILKQFLEKLQLTSAAAALTSPHIAAIAVAIGAVVAIAGAWYKATEDNRKSIDELNADIETNTSKLSDNKERLAEINGMAWNDKTPEILAEKDALEKENAELEAQIEKYQQLKTEKAQAILDNAYGTETTYETRRVRGQETVVPVTELIEGAKYYEQLTLKLQQYQTILSQNKSLTAEQVVEYNNLTSEAGRLASAMENVEGGVASCTNEQQLMYNTLQSTQVAYNDAQTYISNYVNKLLEQAGSTTTAKNEMYNLAAQMIATNNQNLNFSQQLAALQQLATQAGITASAIAGVMGTTEVASKRNLAAWMQTVNPATGKNYTQAEAQQKLLSKYWGKLQTKANYTVTSPSVNTSVPTYTSPSSSKQTQKNKQEAKDAVRDVEKAADTAVRNVSDSVSNAVDDTASQIENALNEQKRQMESIIDYYVEYASRQIDKIDEKLDSINKKYDDMLTAAQNRYNEQLAALEAQYNAVEEQYELQKLMDALEKARNTYQMVYRNGQFVYEVDKEGVRKAQEALNAFKRKKEFEDRKKQLQESLKNELDYIEKLREEKTKQLEEEKKRWEEYKKGWQELTSEFEFQQNKLLADQMFGAEQENATWGVRLANLRSFVSQYNSLMGSLSGGGGGGGGGGGSRPQPGEWAGFGEGYKDDKEAWADITNAYNPLWEKDVDYAAALEEAMSRGAGYEEIRGIIGARNAKIKELGLEGQVESSKDLWERLKKERGDDDGYSGGVKPSKKDDKPSGSSGLTQKERNELQSELMRLEDEIDKDPNNAALKKRADAIAKQLGVQAQYAGGVLSARGGLAMVGEQGPELRVLNQGDGIIPADITRNLMKIGSNPTAFMRGNTTTNTTFNVSSVSLPNVTNAQQFVAGLKNLALQKAYGRT